MCGVLSYVMIVTYLPTFSMLWSCQQLWVGTVKYFRELRGAAKYLKVHRGGSKNLLGYFTSNMHVNTTVQPHNGGQWIFFTHLRRAVKSFFSASLRGGGITDLTSQNISIPLPFNVDNYFNVQCVVFYNWQMGGS